MSLIQRYRTIKDKLPDSVTLIAVSKTKPASDIQELYGEGHRDFGENKVQELTTKAEELPKDIRWHMIGHLQRNKVKYIAPFVHLIHGVDSPRLLKEINKRAKNAERTIDCLLQVHIAEEESKFGFDKEALLEFIESEAFQSYEHIRIRGLMGMATLTDDGEIIKREFRSLKALFEELQSALSGSTHQIDTLSMGMTNDYQLAVEEGSTMVRIGSAIFGERDYSSQ